MALDDYRTLGDSGLRISALCLGTMTFGEDWGWGASPADSHRILSAFLDRGGNFVDTANMYTNGHSEAIIGDFVAGGSVRRDRMVIATKFFCNLYPGDPNGGGAGRKAIVAQCEQSLRRLRTDFIDLYWCHQWDRFTPIEETLRAIDDLVTAGKIRYAGISDTPAWKAAEAQMIARHRGWTPFSALQVEYSLLERTVEAELVPMARAMGMGVTPWSPLRSGALTGKYTRETYDPDEGGRGGTMPPLDEAAFRLIDALKAVAEAHDANPAAVAIAWLAARPGVAAPIIGARTIEQLEANLAGLDVKLTEQETARLDELSQPRLPFPADFLKGAPSIAHGGATVDGVPSQRIPQTPGSDDERW